MPGIISFIVKISFVFFLSSCSGNSRHVTCGHDSPGITKDSLSIGTACRVLTFDFISRYSPKDTTCAGIFYDKLVKTADSLKIFLGNKAHSSDGANSIIEVVYKNWKIEFDPVDTNLESLLPHIVYADKKGACLGLSLIILMLAEKIECPVYGVMLPGHFFCRFDDSAVKFNIEPNKSGFAHTDEYYRNKYSLSKSPWYNLENLTKKEVAGILYYNMGTQCLKRKDLCESRCFLAESVRRCKNFPEAKGNLALTQAELGNKDSALIIFKNLFEQYPSLEHLKDNFDAVTKRH